MVNRYLLPWRPRTILPEATSELAFAITSISGRCYRLALNGCAVTEQENLADVFTFLQQAVDDAVIRSDRSRVAIHAGVVSWRGSAILFPGQSGFGKTTLVRELIMRGTEYCSDEFAMIDSAGLIHPYPRPLMIREKGCNQRPVLAGELGAQVRREPAIPRMILSLRYQSGASFEIHPVNRSESVILLLRNTPQVLAEIPEMLGPLQSVASSAVCFRGVRGDASEAAERILALASELQ